MDITKLKDIKVKIDLKKQNLSKGFLATAKISIPILASSGGFVFVVKGFVIRPSEKAESDGIRGKCWVSLPSTQTRAHQWIKSVYVESPLGKADISAFKEFGDHILRAYYSEIGQLPKDKEA